MPPAAPALRLDFRNLLACEAGEAGLLPLPRKVANPALIDLLSRRSSLLSEMGVYQRPPDEQQIQA
jgi:hypothetical protein